MAVLVGIAIFVDGAIGLLVLDLDPAEHAVGMNVKGGGVAVGGLEGFVVHTTEEGVA